MTSHVFIPLCVVRCLRCCSQGDRRCECANQNKSHHVLSVERLPRCLRAQKNVCYMSDKAPSIAAEIGGWGGFETHLVSRPCLINRVLTRRASHYPPSLRYRHCGHGSCLRWPSGCPPMWVDATGLT